MYSIHSFYHFLSIPSFEIFHMTWETRNRWGRNSHPNLAGEIRQLWSHLEGMVVIDSKTWGVTWCNCTSHHQINTINVGSDHHDTRNANTSRRSCFCLFNSWNFSSRKRGMRVTINIDGDHKRVTIKKKRALTIKMELDFILVQYEIQIMGFWTEKSNGYIDIYSITGCLGSTDYNDYNLEQLGVINFNPQS